MISIPEWAQAFASPGTLSLRDLIQRHPASWHWLPRTSLNAIIFLLSLLMGWYFLLIPAQHVINDQQQDEAQLKLDYRNKLQRTSDLDQLRVEQEELRQRIGWYHQQFSDHDDPGLLLGEIAAIATQHQLTLEMARPAAPVNTPYYQLLPLQLRLLGRYHDIGHFAAALAASPRLFVLGKLQLNSTGEAKDLLQLETSILSFRRAAAPASTKAGS
ncbi:type IV pilus assembly protein PilO [Herbaspirillum sp. Sphag1AN]|uniref:type 4a pilus biogenesis protein PilO n=1 Tax=unclassified Herbaspirillum TaxID=2624150 RepID=UPI00160DD8A2|nr:MULTISPECIES: type 4a pilus biogenesis protein PilO [unclassified Herbaspirillum]MBB3212590.1 type IV pilus assembly protein PilO [Herbaspirillum sp. Sphag1AN]MBB3245787.1 type IV pilus assembly protein PilO [Herbaspirillum sp. Sphag64]